MTFLSFSPQMIKTSDTGPQKTVFLHYLEEGLPPPGDMNNRLSPPTVIPKKKTTRRAGSCEPCRKSKIKVSKIASRPTDFTNMNQCDGKRPECTGCSRRKRAKSKEACVYIPAKERSTGARQHKVNPFSFLLCRRTDTLSQSNRAERHDRSSASPLSTIGEDSNESDFDHELDPEHEHEYEPEPEASSPAAFKGPPLLYIEDEFFGRHGLARCIDKVRVQPPSISSY